MDLFSLLQCLFLFFFFYIFFIFYNSSTINSHRTLKTYPLIGNVPAFMKNRHRFLEWSTNILAYSSTNTFTYRRPGKVQGIITANPVNLEHMLKTNFRNYPKGEPFLYLLQDFLGHGIFNSDDHLWRIQRKTASFEFNTKSLRNSAVHNVRTEIQTRLIPLLLKSTQSAQVIDLQVIFERFTFDNICVLAFDIDPLCLSGEGTIGREFMQAFDVAATISAERFMHAFQFLWKIKRLLNIGSEKKLKESIKIVRNFAEKVIRSKMKEKNNAEADLLSRFIATSEDASEEFLRDVVISFILAGRDTSSAALSWFFWLLTSHPHVELNILEEIKAIRSRTGTRTGNTFVWEELRDMHYLHAAISEAMRLYPPVAIDTKTCLEEDVMPDGTFVGKGWFVLYNTYAMGRMESIWGKDCCEFVPERWLENGTFRAESPFKYPVFHAGPRICLGKDMAYIQMKSVAASMIEQFEIDVEKDAYPGHVLSLTLRMKEGLMVRVKARCMDEAAS